jgi:hypothetical protein
MRRKKAIVNVCAVVASVLGTAAAAAEDPVWKTEVVETAGPGKYSALQIDKDGNLHLVYSVDDGNRFPLKYAFRDQRLGKWFVMTVAQSAGAAAIALDATQRPHISWVDAGSGSGSKLRYAYWNGTKWVGQAIPLNSDVIAYYNSIALDPAGKPTISFYEYRGPKDSDIHIRLRTVTLNGAQWEVRTVDSDEGSGKFNSIASDAQGNMHLAYANVSASTASLRYAFWNGRSWKTEVVDGPEQNNGQAVGYSAYIALDKQGEPHISYINESNSVVKYATRKAGKWHIQSIDRLSAFGYPDRNSVAFDEHGLRHSS